MTGLSTPFTPQLMSAPLPLHPTKCPSPISRHRLCCLQFIYFNLFSVFKASFSAYLGVRVTVLPALLPPLPSLAIPSPLLFPFRNSLSIALLTATHQPGCNLKSPSTAAIPQGWLSVQLPKPRQGLCFSKQLWTSGWFPPIPNRLKVKDSISLRLVQLKTGWLRWSFKAALLLPPWHVTANIWHAVCRAAVRRQILGFT